MTQCMSLHAYEQGFPNRDRVESHSMKGDGKFCLGKIVILTLWTFFKAKNNIL